MSAMAHRTTDELLAGLDTVRSAPADGGTLDLIVRRPSAGEREDLDAGEITLEDGLVGDEWRTRGSRHTDDGSSEVERQLTLMNSRAIALFAGGADGWATAGDQLFVDLDISITNLPPGTRLALGEAVLEVSEKPHTGCAKFAERFGMEVARFVSTPAGKELRLRGMNARVVTPGTVRKGEAVRKLAV